MPWRPWPATAAPRRPGWSTLNAPPCWSNTAPNTGMPYSRACTQWCTAPAALRARSPPTFRWRSAARPALLRSSAAPTTKSKSNVTNCPGFCAIMPCLSHSRHMRIPPSLSPWWPNTAAAAPRSPRRWPPASWRGPCGKSHEPQLADSRIPAPAVSARPAAMRTAADADAAGAGRTLRRLRRRFRHGLAPGCPPRPWRGADDYRQPDHAGLVSALGTLALRDRPGVAGDSPVLRGRPRREPLAGPWRHPLPALGNDEDRRTADAGGLAAQKTAAAGPHRLRGLRASDCDPDAADRQPAGPRYVVAGRRRRWHGAVSVRSALALDCGRCGHRDCSRTDALERIARVPAQSRPDVPRSGVGSSRPGLEHHPVQDRGRHRRTDRAGMARQYPVATRVSARAAYRLHSFGHCRRIRLCRRRGVVRSVCRHRAARDLPRVAGPRSVRSNAGCQPGISVLRLPAGQRRHDQRRDAGGRRAAAAGELRRHLGGDAAGGLRYYHELL